MAEVQQQQVLPAPHIEAASKVYLEDLAKGIGEARQVDLSKLYGQQFVAPESALTQQARGLSTGLGGYQPYLQAAQAATGPQAYQQYMSPYQQDVINTTLANYDVQAQKGLPSLAAQAIGAGAFGGGREGVQRAEYQTQSDLNRALLQAQLQQQGYGQAQQLAANQYTQQLGLGQAQQGFLGGQIAGLSTLGAQQQAQGQRMLDYPMTQAKQFSELMKGYTIPMGQTQQTVKPGEQGQYSNSPLAQISSLGTMLASLMNAPQANDLNSAQLAQTQSATAKNLGLTFVSPGVYKNALQQLVDWAGNAI